MKNRKPPISRRNFLVKGSLAAVATLAAAVSSGMAKESKKKSSVSPMPPPEVKSEDPIVTESNVELNLTVNSQARKLTVPAGKTLAEVLREDFGLTSVKIGCGSAACGTCTVLVNTRPIYSCSYLAVLADNALIETVEGITPKEGELHPIQKAFIEKDALQCGYCTPGMICSTRSLFFRNPTPDIEDIRSALAGNLCRCGAYNNIIEAVQAASERQ